MNPAPQRVEIPSFPGGKRIAVTTSFDDGVIEDRRVIAAFNEWGLKGTFNLNSGAFGRPANVAASEVASLYRGHEVAVHTVTHPHLPKLDPAQIAREVLDDRIALEDLVGYPVRGMAYPYGTYNKMVIDCLRQLGIVYARTTENAGNCFPRPNLSRGRRPRINTPPPRPPYRNASRPCTKTKITAASSSSGGTPTNSTARTTGRVSSASTGPSPASPMSGTAPTANCSTTRVPGAAWSSPPTAPPPSIRVPSSSPSGSMANSSTFPPVRPSPYACRSELSAQPGP